jgi:hypothetical protein
VNSAIIATYIKDHYHGYKEDIKGALNVSEAVGLLCLQEKELNDFRLDHYLSFCLCDGDMLLFPFGNLSHTSFYYYTILYVIAKI